MITWWWSVIILHIGFGKTQILYDNCFSNFSEATKNVYFDNPLMKILHSISYNYDELDNIYQHKAKQEKRNPKFHSWGGKRNDNEYSSNYNHYNLNLQSTFGKCSLGYLDFYFIIYNPPSIYEENGAKYIFSNMCKRLYYNCKNRKTSINAEEVITTLMPLIRNLNKSYLQNMVRKFDKKLHKQHIKQHTYDNGVAGKRDIDNLKSKTVVASINGDVNSLMYTQCISHVKRIATNIINYGCTTANKCNISIRSLKDKINMCNQAFGNKKYIEIITIIFKEGKKDKHPANICYNSIKEVHEPKTCQLVCCNEEHIEKMLVSLSKEYLNCLIENNEQSEIDNGAHSFNSVSYESNIMNNNYHHTKEITSLLRPSKILKFEPLKHINTLDDKRAKSNRSWAGNRQTELNKWDIQSEAPVKSQECKDAETIYSCAGEGITRRTTMRETNGVGVDYAYKTWKSDSVYGILHRKNALQSDDRKEILSSTLINQDKNKMQRSEIDMKSNCIVKSMINNHSFRQKKSKPFNSWGGKRSSPLKNVERGNWNEILTSNIVNGRVPLHTYSDFLPIQCYVMKAVTRIKLTALNNIFNKLHVTDLCKHSSFNNRVKKRGFLNDQQFLNEEQLHFPEINKSKTKRTVSTLSNCKQKRSPLFSTWYLNKQPNIQLSNGKRRPAFSSWGGKRNGESNNPIVKEIQNKQSNISECSKNSQDIMRSENHKTYVRWNVNVNDQLGINGKGEYAQARNACKQHDLDLPVTKKNCMQTFSSQQINSLASSSAMFPTMLWPGVKKQLLPFHLI